MYKKILTASEASNYFFSPALNRIVECTPSLFCIAKEYSTNELKEKKNIFLRSTVVLIEEKDWTREKVSKVKLGTS